MRSQKHTAWKKSRKFGDFHGDKSRPKITDKIFNRLDSFSVPGPHDSTPILVEEIPSSDHYFPLDGAECLEALSVLPEIDRDGVTHLWLRRPTTRDRKNGHPHVQFICGRGVRLIVLYAWRQDFRLCLGRRKPSGKSAKEYQRFAGKVFQESGKWCVEFTEDGVRRYTEYLLLDIVGHHAHWFHDKWSQASNRGMQESVRQYAMSFSREGTDVLDYVDKN